MAIKLGRLSLIRQQAPDLNGFRCMHPGEVLLLYEPHCPHSVFPASARVYPKRSTTSTIAMTTMAAPDAWLTTLAALGRVRKTALALYPTAM